jgi:hypothetical protein
VKSEILRINKEILFHNSTYKDTTGAQTNYITAAVTAANTSMHNPKKNLCLS